MAVKPVDQATYIKSSLLASELRAKIDGMQLSGVFPVTTVPGGIQRFNQRLIMRAAAGASRPTSRCRIPLTDIAPARSGRGRARAGRDRPLAARQLVQVVERHRVRSA